MTKIKEILRLSSQGISQRNISSILKCSRNTVSKVLKRAEELEMLWPHKQEYSDPELQELFFPSVKVTSKHMTPDYEYIHNELMKSSVTLKLLWSEYCEQARLSGKHPLMYSQFCNLYQKHSRVKRATMTLHHKPGERIEVDWAGKTAFIYDRISGEKLPIYIFVATLPYSLYSYVEGFYDQSQASWIDAHVNMFRFFQGSTKLLIPDNLKTGVIKSDYYDPLINKAYAELAEHYNTVVLPARVRKPKDKPSVEGTVGIISTWILAALRNHRFFTLGELNQAIQEKLVQFNHEPFQKKEGSRYSNYLEEQNMLIPLPTSPYELAEWKIATVQYNYHITINKMNYSVPYEYIGHKVEVRIASRTLEVYFNNHRLCTHKTLLGRPGQYLTDEKHMPEKHQKYLKWDGDRFIKWAEKIGPNTKIVIAAILSSHKIEQQAFKSCMGVIKLSEKHTEPILEAACKKALEYTPTPSYKSIKTLVGTVSKVGFKQEAPKTESFGFTRGADYYGRK